MGKQKQQQQSKVNTAPSVRYLAVGIHGLGASILLALVAPFCNPSQTCKIIQSSLGPAREGWGGTEGSLPCTDVDMEARAKAAHGVLSRGFPSPHSPNSPLPSRACHLDITKASLSSGWFHHPVFHLPACQKRVEQRPPLLSMEGAGPDVTHTHPT